jgi:ATP-dependent DNA ligase
VIVGWIDPEGSGPHLGALLLGYYTDDGKPNYAGRVGTGMSQAGSLVRLKRQLDSEEVRIPIRVDGDGRSAGRTVQPRAYLQDPVEPDPRGRIAHKAKFTMDTKALL